MKRKVSIDRMAAYELMYVTVLKVSSQGQVHKICVWVLQSAVPY